MNFVISARTYQKSLGKIGEDIGGTGIDIAERRALVNDTDAPWRIDNVTWSCIKTGAVDTSGIQLWLGSGDEYNEIFTADVVLDSTIGFGQIVTLYKGDALVDTPTGEMSGNLKSTLLYKTTKYIYLMPGEWLMIPSTYSADSTQPWIDILVDYSPQRDRPKRDVRPASTERGTGTTITTSPFIENDSPFLAVVDVTATGAVSPTRETMYVCDATLGAIILTLPAATGLSGLRLYTKKVDDVAYVTLGSSSNIDGFATKVLTTKNQSLTMVSDGTTWRVT